MEEKGMRIIDGCYDRTGAFTLINGVIIANGLKMPEITQEMIEKCDVDMDDIVVFSLPSVSKDIKECLVDAVENSHFYNMEGHEIDSYSFDLMAAANGEKITFAMICISTNYKKCKDSLHICGSDYDAFIVDFNDKVEHDNLLRAVNSAYENI